MQTGIFLTPFQRNACASRGKSFKSDRIKINAEKKEGTPL
jgi:hypothetical protein